MYVNAAVDSRFNIFVCTGSLPNTSFAQNRKKCTQIISSDHKESFPFKNGDFVKMLHGHGQTCLASDCKSEDVGSTNQK